MKNTKTTQHLIIDNVRLKLALSQDYLAIFHTRDEIKATLAAYLEIGSLREAKSYILPRLGFLNKKEANNLLSRIYDEMINERTIHDVNRKTISCGEGQI